MPHYQCKCGMPHNCGSNLGQAPELRFVVVGHAPLPIIINPPLDQAYKRLVAVALVLETQSVHGQNVCEFARFSTSHVVMTHKNICDCHIPFGPSC
jgi:hypothetical protein